jgi:flagellum-specific ATP synthase
MLRLNVAKLRQEIQNYDVFRTAGKLRSATGVLTCTLPAAVGDQCEINVARDRSILAEVIGFANGVAFLMPYENAEEVHPSMTVVRKGHGLSFPVGERLLGRVLDGLGRPIDGRGPIDGCERRPAETITPSPLARARIRQPFVTGQRALDGLLTLGRGQRIGIFAGSGVGKSTLLGEIAKGSEADINVIALIGERGREVRPFLDDCLGPAGMQRSIVVVSTCEQPPLMRVRAAQAATTMAHAYREKGANVLFMLDSMTRLAMAQRELGLALGEPPTARGYTPSVFHLLATTLEHLGNSERGSITGIVTILVDGGDLDEPISDATRAMLDGHIVLDRKLAERGHFPAISIPQSISRTSRDVTDAAHQAAARKLRTILALYAEMEDLIHIGAYARGSNAQVDRAIDLMPALQAFLRQEVGERTSWDECRAALERIAGAWPY